MKKISGGFSIFNAKHERFGGHNQNLAKKLNLDYLMVDFGFRKFEYDHYWYEGQHHVLSLGLFRIMWGGKPFKDKEE